VAALLVFMALCRLVNTADGAEAKEDHTEEDAALEAIDEQRGVVKRFSDRNGWGLITVGVSGGQALQTVAEAAKTTSAQARAARRDVRFYREERDSLGVDVGDAVAFHLRRDDDANGWLCTTKMRRSSRSPEPAAQAPPRKEKLEKQVKQAQRPTARRAESRRGRQRTQSCGPIRLPASAEPRCLRSYAPQQLGQERYRRPCLGMEWSVSAQPQRRWWPGGS